jgi:hypothetical protein
MRMVIFVPKEDLAAHASQVLFTPRASPRSHSDDGAASPVRHVQPSGRGP